MKKILLPVCIAISANVFAQSPNWLWAKRAGGSGYDGAYSVVTDKDGNEYVAGFFKSPVITFGSTTLINASSSGTDDIFIVKYDESGNVIWAKSAGGTGGEVAKSLAFDANGYVFVTGDFYSSGITFGTTTLFNANTNSSADVFIAKYDTAGNVIWAKSIGGSLNDFSGAAAADPLLTGSVYLVGTFLSSSLVLDTTTLINAGGYDMFIAKYDSGGNVIWAKREGGSDWDGGNTVTADVNGNLLAGGWFESASIVFDTITLLNSGTQGPENLFIVKYDGNGNAVWANSAGGKSAANSVATDADGDVLVTGYFENSSITFDSTILNNAGPQGSSDMFFVKYSATGNILWAKSAGGSATDNAYSIATDAYNNFYVTGSFYSSSFLFGSTLLTNADNTGTTEDIFLIKFDTDGTELWAKSAGGGSNPDAANSVASDASGNLFITGVYYSSPISFDTTTLVSSGLDDVFLAKLSACGFPATPICLVTVDSTSTKNVIVWEKPVTASIDSFRIYRDVVGTFTYIGAVDYDSLSKFADTTNGINPNITAYKYEISVLDTCGNESALSTYHRTIYLQINSGVNLSWTDYEGFSFTYYRIFRDTSGNNNWQPMDSTAAGTTVWTDINPPVNMNNNRYYVEVVHPGGACVATKSSESHNTSRSNVKLGIAQPGSVDEIKNENLEFRIEPNPNNGEFVLRITNNEQGRQKSSGLLSEHKGEANYEVKIFNILGVEIYRILNTDYRIPITISLNHPPGIYNVQLITNTNVANKKVVIE